MQVLGAVLRLVATMAGLFAAVFLLAALGRRLFPPRCPECRSLAEKQTTCVYEDEKRDYIILPKVNLIRETCPVCGHKTRELDAEAGPSFFERGPKTGWPFGRTNRPEDARPVVRAVMEFDRVFRNLLDLS